MDGLQRMARRGGQVLCDGSSAPKVSACSDFFASRHLSGLRSPFRTKTNFSTRREAPAQP